MTYRLFLSHGSADAYIVDQLIEPKLAASGADVFTDRGGIDYGEDFRKTLFSELERMHELVVFLTKSSIQRPWVAAEIGVAAVRNRRVIPVLYGTNASELQQLGILSLLGSVMPLELDDLDDYVVELTNRVAANNG